MGLRLYHESTAKEIESIKNRVRNLIGDHHWYSDGWFKEVVLINAIKRFLPENLTIGSGFVIGIEGFSPEKNHLIPSSQLDILIFDNRYPKLFTEGNFFIVTPDSVRAIIEVKSKISSFSDLYSIVEKMNENGRQIFKQTGTSPEKNHLFNGIFAYEYAPKFMNPEFRKTEFKDIEIKKIEKNLKEWEKKENFSQDGSVNFICVGDLFFRVHGKENDWKKRETISVYDLKALSTSYFISNLLDFITDKPISHNHFYSINKDEPPYHLCNFLLLESLEQKILGEIKQYQNRPIDKSEIIKWFSDQPIEYIELSIQKLLGEFEIWSPSPESYKIVNQTIQNVLNINELKGKVKKLDSQNLNNLIGIVQDVPESFDEILRCVEAYIRQHAK